MRPQLHISIIRHRNFSRGFNRQRCHRTVVIVSRRSLSLREMRALCARRREEYARMRTSWLNLESESAMGSAAGVTTALTLHYSQDLLCKNVRNLWWESNSGNWKHQQIRKWEYRNWNAIDKLLRVSNSIIYIFIASMESLTSLISSDSDSSVLSYSNNQF